jgi:hypothetical protein
MFNKLKPLALALIIGVTGTGSILNMQPVSAQAVPQKCTTCINHNAPFGFPVVLAQGNFTIVASDATISGIAVRSNNRWTLYFNKYNKYGSIGQNRAVKATLRFFNTGKIDGPDGFDCPASSFVYTTIEDKNVTPLEISNAVNGFGFRPTSGTNAENMAVLSALRGIKTSASFISDKEVTIHINGNRPARPNEVTTSLLAGHLQYVKSAYGENGSSLILQRSTTSRRAG